MDEKLHVIPVNDLKEHICDGSQCWCNPDDESQPGLIVHNSLDRRELYENLGKQ